MGYALPQPWIDSADLKWESNWNGYEVGHPDHAVVGLYRWRDSRVYFYLDAETNEIVNIWENWEE